ncbi:hypothetical protein K438DRAFT_2019563 [Mycena galopus ATCC 62051]|nr:hypothetical protein K438DRAFT_2019563 [Mycena galopus ATCC 62051]
MHEEGRLRAFSSSKHGDGDGDRETEYEAVGTRHMGTKNRKAGERRMKDSSRATMRAGARIRTRHFQRSSAKDRCARLPLLVLNDTGRSSHLEKTALLFLHLERRDDVTARMLLPHLLVFTHALPLYVHTSAYVRPALGSPLAYWSVSASLRRRGGAADDTISHVKRDVEGRDQDGAVGCEWQLQQMRIRTSRLASMIWMMEIIGREGQRTAHSADRVEFRKQEADGVDADAVASMRLRLRWCMSRGDVRGWKADVGRQNRPEKKETDIEQNTGHIVVRSRAGLGRRDRLPKHIICPLLLARRNENLGFPRTPTDEAPTRHACSLRTCWSFLLHIIYVGPALAWPCDPRLGYGSRYPRGVRPDAPGGGRIKPAPWGGVAAAADTSHASRIASAM